MSTGSIGGSAFHANIFFALGGALHWFCFGLLAAS